jgi:hypothetical protein
MSRAIRTNRRKETPMSDPEQRSQIELAIDQVLWRDRISRR